MPQFEYKILTKEQEMQDMTFEDVPFAAYVRCSDEIAEEIARSIANNRTRYAVMMRRLPIGSHEPSRTREFYSPEEYA